MKNLRSPEQLKRDKNRLSAVLYVLMAASIVYAAVRYAATAPGIITDEPGGRTRGDYALMIVQCVLGMAVIYLPAFLEKRMNIDIPDALEILYMVFLFCAIYLGEVRNFYFRVPHWDDFLHAMSGGMLAVIGFYLVWILNRMDKLPITLSPFFVAFFAFCFAVTCGVIWEIYEFSVDRALGMNMQKFLTVTGEPLTGAEALTDTMFDLIVDSISALFVSVIGYFSVKRPEKKK